MTTLTDGMLRAVVREGGTAATLAPADRLAIVRSLLDAGCVVSSGLSTGDREPAPGLVVGRFGGTPPADVDGALAVDLDARDAPDLADLVGKAREARHLARPGAWKPWFPVLDYNRCTNCMQCLSFCLFDVYGVSPEGKIEVRNQNNCKTDCPACSRVCPEVAIMFPKYRHSPINGDEISADDVRREAMKVDISSLLGGDIYAALRDRSAKAKSRFSKERDDERALKERQNCLVKLQQALDVPPEVIAALPSLDEIRTKADAALARAREATKSPKTN